MGYVLFCPAFLEPHLKSPRKNLTLLPFPSLPLADNNDNVGLITAYGAYAHYYTNSLLPNSTATDIAWPGTLPGGINNSSGSHIGSIFRSGDIYSHSSALRGEFFRRRFLV